MMIRFFKSRDLREKGRKRISVLIAGSLQRLLPNYLCRTLIVLSRVVSLPNPGLFRLGCLQSHISPYHDPRPYYDVLPGGTLTTVNFHMCPHRARPYHMTGQCAFVTQACNRGPCMNLNRVRFGSDLPLLWRF